MTLRRAVAVLALSILVCSVPAVFAETPAAPVTSMTNEDVLKLVKLNLGDDLVISAIRRAPSVEFRLDTEGLTALKSGGASNDVIKAMFARTEPAPSAAPPAAAAAPPTDRLGRCVAGATTTGSTMSGRTTIASVDVAETDPAKVVAQLETFIKARGFNVTGKKANEISFERPPVIEEMQADILRFKVSGGKVEGRYEIARGTLTHYDTHQMLCKLLVTALP